MNYIGIDHNEECVKLARKKFSKSKFYINNNLEKFKEEKFDLVFSTGTLHHIKFYKKILFQMIRCSKRYVFIDCPRLVVSKKKTVKMDLSERFKSKTSPKSRNYVSYYLCNKKLFRFPKKKFLKLWNLYLYWQVKI